MRLSALALLLALQPAAAAERSKSKNSPAVQQYYSEALDLYARENYREAIIKWTAILKEDPDQKTAQTMIETARQRIIALTKQRRQRTFDYIGEGDYRKASLELQSLLDQDPGDPDLETLQRRLDDLIKVAPELNPRARPGRAAVLGVKGYLTIPPDLKLAHNGLRYARELSPRNEVYQNLMDRLYADYPALASADAPTQGMKLLEYKHHVALHQIYDGKHHQAVITLGEILTLEPSDLLALKRLGSANYSLGRYGEARSAWSAALKLAPKDKTLKHFLSKINKVRKYKSSEEKP